MRFVTAAAILAQTVPIIAQHSQSSSYDLGRPKQENRGLSQYGQKRFENSEPFMRTRRRLRLRNALKNGIVSDYRQKHFKSPSKLRNKGALRNVSRNSGNLQECDPLASTSADIGVLRCGVDEYCVESDYSNHGGFCLSSGTHSDLNQRSLKANFYPPSTVCDPNHDDFGSYDCECGDFDVDRNLGAFTCNLYENQCKRENLCGSNDVTQTVSSDGTTRADYCYDFENPSDIYMCYSFDTSRECNISVQNVDCAKCEVVDGVVHPVYGFVGYNCYEFDCTNTLAGIAGNNCAGDYVLDALNGLTMPSSQPSEPPPSPHPSSVPSQKPSDHPSVSPTVTSSSGPTRNPSSAPSLQPSSSPTRAPSSQPSWTPTQAPSVEPTPSPSLSPTKVHSSFPTQYPSSFPSQKPSHEASSFPTQYPSSSPSQKPSHEASSVPSRVASANPSVAPSDAPSESTPEPSTAPSFEPWSDSKEDESDASRGQGATSSTRTTSLALFVASAMMLVVQYG